LILAFSLYSEIPFGRFTEQSESARAGALLGRAGISFDEAEQFARLDPALQARGIVGLQRAQRRKEIWEDSESDPRLWPSINSCSRKSSVNEWKTLPKFAPTICPASGRDAVIRVRVNQSFFRRRILSA
jgi:hypothetical protein